MIAPPAAIQVAATIKAADAVGQKVMVVCQSKTAAERMRGLVGETSTARYVYFYDAQWWDLHTGKSEPQPAPRIVCTVILDDHSVAIVEPYQ